MKLMRSLPTDPPDFLNVGSLGDLVNEGVIDFLTWWTSQNRIENTGLKRDGYFGPIAAFLMRSFQESVSIKPDGNCGPVTRAAMLAQGFNFFDKARALHGNALNTCLQPDGKVLVWVPGEEPTESVSMIRALENIAKTA